MRLCAECKGKGDCGLPRCPVMSRFHAGLQTVSGREYQGSSPSVFIGSYRYPAVNGGPLMGQDPDHPPEWISRGLGIDDIVGIRAGTIRGSSRVSRWQDQVQEIARSSRPLDIEVTFSRPVSFSLAFDGTIVPIGLTGSMESLAVIDNARVEPAVERVTGDTDLGAFEACDLLHQAGIDVYRTTELLSSGLLGRHRRIVPTRWSITAVDDMVSERLKQQISRHSPVPVFQVHSAELYGNRIACILCPGDWRFEMIEHWTRGSLWAGETECIVRDHEGGRKKAGYSPIGGAYYAARLAVCEYLSGAGRCARVILTRSVSGDYWAPLGVWVVREAVRAAMRSPPVICASLDEAVQVAGNCTGQPHLFGHSSLIPGMKAQKQLGDFLR